MIDEGLGYKEPYPTGIFGFVRKIRQMLIRIASVLP
jgi:hypothetical protein